MTAHMMMLGTDGKPEYLIFARKGTIGLGIKPNLISEGKIKGTTWVQARLRSAPLPEGAIPASGVFNFEHAKLGLTDAWPSVTWEKEDEQRASTTVGILIEGTPKTQVKKLLTELSLAYLPSKMAGYLTGLAGAENLMLSTEELAKWLADFYAPIRKKLHDMVALEEAYTKELSDSVGNFTMAADLLKKAHATVAQGKPMDDVPDADDDEDGDENA